MTTIKAVWINKSSWKKLGLITYMGLLNALSFAWNGVETDFFIDAKSHIDIESDLTHYYGLSNHPLLSIRKVLKKTEKNGIFIGRPLPPFPITGVCSPSTGAFAVSTVLPT